MAKCASQAWIAAFLLAILASPAAATTYNTPTVDDGVPPSTQDPETDPSWAADELFVEDPVWTEGRWGPNNDLQGLWITWDRAGIFFGVSGALWDAGAANSVNLYIDIDYGKGTGTADLSEVDAEALGAITRNFERNFTVGGGFGCDWGFTSWAGRYDLGFLDIADPAAPINLFQGVTDASSVNTHTSPEGVIESRNLANNRGYELFVPWEVFFPEAPAGQVPAGTQMAFVIAQVGGGDSLSPEAIPDLINPDAGDRNFDSPVVVSVDSNADGIPDGGWPPSSRILGTVIFSDPTDTLTVVDVVATNRDSGEELRTSTPPGGGSWQLLRVAPGSYSVGIESRLYVAEPQIVSVAEGEVVEGVEILAEKVDSGIDLGLSFLDGPEATQRSLDIRWQLRRASDGSVFSEDTIEPAEPIDLVRVAPVLPGAYELEIWTRSSDPAVDTYTGYKPVQVDVTVRQDEYTDLGTLELRLVVGTRLVFTEFMRDGFGEPTAAGFVPESLPPDFRAYLAVQVALVDPDGDEALIDPSIKSNTTITITGIQPPTPPRGDVQLWSFADTTAVGEPRGSATLEELEPDAPVRTRASFLVTNAPASPGLSALEVFLLRADHPTLERGELEVKTVPRQPFSISLTIADEEMIAGDELTLSAQLLDINGNASAVGEIPIEFVVEPGLEGRALVNPAIVLSDNDGSAGRSGGISFISVAAGEFAITASADVGASTIGSDTLRVLVRPADPEQLSVNLELLSRDRVGATVQLEDRYGNRIEGRPLSASIATSPPELVSEAPADVEIGNEGTVSFEVGIQPGLAGVLEVTASSASLPKPQARSRLEILAGLVAVDEPRRESEDLDNNTALRELDLTTVFANVQQDTLVVTIPFSSTFGGVHSILLLELNGNAAGAVRDPFEFPVEYAHPLLPDFVFTYKYSAADYGDLRRPVPGGPPGQWQWYDWTSSEWLPDVADGANAVSNGHVFKDAARLTYRVPLRELKPDFVVGSDEVGIQVYLAQEENGKRPALDSVPQDATVDLDPPGRKWYDALPPSTTLSNLETTVVEEPGNNLRVTDARFAPSESSQGETVRLLARPEFIADPPPTPALQVFADLTGGLGAQALAPMVDDGTDGDEVAGDGIYTLQFDVPRSIFGGDYSVLVRALELTTGQQATARAQLLVVGEPELIPILAATDSLGDDHGPNQPGREFLYYLYPSSGVFFDGVFDLTGLQLFDQGDRLLFRVGLRDITDPSEPNAADWQAIFPSDACPEGSRTDLNLQNVVILLDTKSGGSVNLPSNRWADVSGHDAWEYALVSDGWWQGLVKSNGQSEQGAWRTFTDPESEFFFCSSSRNNTIDLTVFKDMFEEQELNEIERWDIIVLLSGHDGDSNASNWGAVRWVNQGLAQEWQFGGGRNGEDNRERDPNIIDILTIPGNDPLTGRPKPAGRTQEEQLDFLTPVAIDRFAQRLDAVQLEATELIDDLPPSVRFVGVTPKRAVVPSQILLDSPVVLRADIVDQPEQGAGVAEATLFWRGPAEPESARREVPMGLLRGDVEINSAEWVADLRWEDVEAATIPVMRVAPDGTAREVRNILVSVRAVDKLGNATDDEGIVEEVVEIPLEPVTEILYRDLLSLTENGEIRLDLNEGSRATLRASTLEALSTGQEGERFDLLLTAVAAEDLDFSYFGDRNRTILRREDRYLGIARELSLLRFDAAGEATVIRDLPEPLQLSLHFPRYELDQEHPSELQFFRWNEQTRRWILVGAHGERSGGTATARVQQLGIYGVFVKPDEDLQTNEIVTGLQLTPNPFSPNGDGLYDELNITYVLPRPTDWALVEIFDMRGERVRTIQYFVSEGVTNRTLGLLWDGRDDEGNYVPLGIYVVRVEARESASDRVERATKAVAVVR